MKTYTILIALGILSACGDIPVTEPTPVEGETWARELVEENFEEALGATPMNIRLNQYTKEGVCGTAELDGQEETFYADFVDNEVFLADGPMAMIYDLNCGEP